MNTSSVDDFVWCHKCDTYFENMDLLVDHLSVEHNAFDQVVTPQITIGRVQLSDD